MVIAKSGPSYEVTVYKTPSCLPGLIVETYRTYCFMPGERVFQVGWLKMRKFWKCYPPWAALGGSIFRLGHDSKGKNIKKISSLFATLPFAPPSHMGHICET